MVATDRTEAQAAPAVVGAPRDASADLLPYTPSWVDRLQIAVERLPVPWWLPYLAAFGVLQAVGHLFRWADGSLPVGELQPAVAPMFGAFMPPFILAAIHHLDRVAGRQLDIFAPALATDGPEVERTRFELATLPARPVAWLTVVATTLPTAAYLLTADLTTTAALPAFVLSVVMLALSVGTAAIFYLHTVRQLLLVHRLHAAAREVDPFRPGPVQAFSVLAAQTGIAFAVLAYYAAAVRPDLVLTTAVGVTWVVAAIGCGIAAFVLPLWGLHRRLAGEKGRLLAEADARLRDAVNAVWADARRGPTAEADALGQQLESVERARQIVARLPTWPWATPTLTGFISAFVAPVALWAVTRLLERVLV